MSTTLSKCRGFSIRGLGFTAALCIPAATLFAVEAAKPAGRATDAKPPANTTEESLFVDDKPPAEALPLPTHDPAVAPSDPMPVIAVTDPATGAELPSLEALPPPTDVPEPPPLENPSQNVTINLINRLVDKGILTHAEADEMIKMAAADAARARAAAEAALPPPVTGDTVRVTYVPEVVKAQIRDQIKDEIIAQAKEEQWLAGDPVPDWVNRIQWNGDIRVRFEADLFPLGNDNTGSFPNFNAINTGSPFDISGTQFSPQLNVDQERLRMRIRARLGADIFLDEGFTAGIRFATGDNNSPASANQSLGQANQGQGGSFSKYAVWIDRAFLKYEIGGDPDSDLALMMGRFDNPFYTDTQLIWDDDLGFDGVALKARHTIGQLTPFLNGGIFPVFNTDFHFASNQPAKFESHDKWLYGIQGGIEWKPSEDITAKFAAALFDYENVEGVLSDPYIPLTDKDAGNTDNTRPSFAQKGNTYMALRDIIPSVLNDFGTSKQYQYFGLATPFRVASFNGRIDLNFWEPYQLSIFGDYARNLDFNQAEIEAMAVNNRGAIEAEPVVDPVVDPEAEALVADEAAAQAPEIGAYEGGDTAWSMNVQFGKEKLEKRWDWNVGLGYRYIESDAVIDGFNDSDFGLGGTNMEGYTVSAAIALSPRVSFRARYMNANEIAGPPLKSDVFLFDFSAKF